MPTSHTRARTGRDLTLLHTLADHQVLTTTQISQLWGAPLRRTQHRLAVLYTRHLLDRFRPYTDYGAGSAPYHWVLAATGAREAAAARDTTPAALGFTTHHTTHIAYSPQLAHRIAANGLFTALIAHTHTHPDTRLAAWWPPGAFAAHYPAGVQPDGYGIWYETTSASTHARLAFCLEHDTGTETLARLASKLDRYTRLAGILQATEPLPVVLFRFLSAGREQHVRAELAGHRALRTGTLRVATTVLADPPPTSPAGPIWRPLPDPDPTAGPRSLAELANPAPHPPVWQRH